MANLSVLLAAVGVWSLSSMWPDLLIGSMIAILFLHSAFYVIRESRKV
jgi:Co/Zn/Cd efflux system component